MEGDPDMKDIKWNGREIRNAFQTAVALADYEFSQRIDKEPGDAAELTHIHFEKVCSIALQFKDYLKAVHNGLDEGRRAGVGGGPGLMPSLSETCWDI
ncbi:hypothetical protein F4778DRAFT_785938 [Xylariomycetidae sp. FL2044]|nr:hypothetical protein F4778DRAFT_785938 [Xylariomycetidae sp. FL2044]